jgi:hypothetical protein
VFQQLFDLSDVELEFQVNDSLSFEEFLGLRVMKNSLGPAEFRLQAFRGRQELLAQPARPSTNDVTYTQIVP